MRVIDTYRTVMSLAYSPCGRFLYSAGWQHISRWDVFSGEELSLNRDTAATYLLNLVISPSGEALAWHDLARQRVTVGGTAVHRTPKWSHRPFQIELGSQPNVLFHQKARPLFHSDAIASDPTGTVAALIRANRLHLIKVPNTGMRSARWMPDLEQELTEKSVEVFHARPQRFGFASANLLWWHHDKKFFLRDLTSGSTRQLDCLDRLPLAVTPDGHTGIATSSREVLLIDLASGLTRERFNWDVGTVEAVLIAPDGLTAAVAGWAGGIAIFDLDG